MYILMREIVYLYNIYEQVSDLPRKVSTTRRLIITCPRRKFSMVFAKEMSRALHRQMIINIIIVIVIAIIRTHHLFHFLKLLITVPYYKHSQLANFFEVTRRTNSFSARHTALFTLSFKNLKTTIFLTGFINERLWRNFFFFFCASCASTSTLSGIHRQNKRSSPVRMY